MCWAVLDTFLEKTFLSATRSSALRSMANLESPGFQENVGWQGFMSCLKAK